MGFATETETYEQADKERLAKIATGKETLEISEADRRKQALLQFGTESADYEKAKLTPEYTALTEKADVLKEYGIGEKELKKAKENYETVKDIPLDQAGYENFEDYLKKWADKGKYETLSKRKSKKLTKKYDKKKEALLPKVDPYQFKREIYETPEELEPGEKPTYEFKPGVAPEAFTEEAPTLQGISQEEVGKIEREVLTKLHKSGVDLSANIAKAKTNRETTDFFKTFTAGNMTTDQMWSHPYAVANPAKVAAYISKDKKAQAAEDKQFAQHAAINEYITASQVEDDPLTPGNEKDLAMSNVVNTPAFTDADPSTQFRIINETQQSMNASAKARATDVKAADKFANVKNEVGNIMHVLGQLGEGKLGQELMDLLNQDGNEQNVTDAHQARIKEILGEIDISGVDVEAQLKAMKGMNLLTPSLEGMIRTAAKEGDVEAKQKFVLKILNKINKEEFRRDEKQIAQTKTKVPGF